MTDIDRRGGRRRDVSLKGRWERGVTQTDFGVGLNTLWWTERGAPCPHAYPLRGIRPVVTARPCPSLTRLPGNPELRSFATAWGSSVQFRHTHIEDIR